jgi:hypothetical protein
MRRNMRMAYSRRAFKKLSALHPLYKNHTSADKCAQDSPSKAACNTPTRLDCCEVDTLVHKPDKKTKDDSKHYPHEKGNLMFRPPRHRVHISTLPSLSSLFLIVGLIDRAE